MRIELAVQTVMPELRVIAPMREWRMNREQEIEYAKKHNIPITVTEEAPYSIDENLWGRSIEAGILENPDIEPPEDVFEWTVAPEMAPSEPCYVTIEFKHGIPVALDGERMSGVDLISKLNHIGGKHGVGRIDKVENRLVGIKSREVYEAPSAIVLHKAHKAIEDVTLSKEQARFKAFASQQYADMVYNGLWFSAFHQDLRGYIVNNQRNVSGTVRVKLQQGNCNVAGRQSPMSFVQL